MNISDELNGNNAEKNSYESHIGRESHVVPGYFGEPLKVTNAQYSQGNASAHPTPVSYTHLTLPTKRIV